MEGLPGKVFVGREQRRAAMLFRVPVGVLCWIWWCSLLVPCITAIQPQELFLNSIAHCGLGDERSLSRKVDEYSLYSIKDDVSPHTRTATILKSCEITFRSTRADGRVCVFQRRLQFMNSNMELKLYDGEPGVDGKTEPDKKGNEDDEIHGVEWCTKSRYLTVEMVPLANDASVKNLEIDLLIYDMRSVHRKAFLDTSPSCGSTIELDHSKVNVTSLDITTKESEVHWMCYLKFTYTGQEENRTLCMVFEPRAHQQHSQCKFNYTLEVHLHLPQEDGSFREVLSHEGGCDKPLPERWCSNTTALTLKLIRDKGVKETYELFHALILDHNGDARTLPSLFVEPEDRPVKEKTQIIVWGIVGTIVIIILITIVIVVTWRQHQSRRAEAKANAEVSSRMLSNGKNHYTTGTPQHL